MYSSDTLRSSDDDATYCIACGDVVPLSKAREYDKHGEQSDRQDGRLETLCLPCHREYSHVSRSDLESLLVAAGAGTADDATFLRRYSELIQER